MKALVFPIALAVAMHALFARQPRSQDPVDKNNYSGKSVVLDYRRRAVDECVIVIRPNPPKSGMGTAKTMAIMIDYDRVGRGFDMVADRPIRLNGGWSDPSVANCSQQEYPDRYPVIDRLKSVEFYIASFVETDPKIKATACIRSSKDANNVSHTKLLESTAYSAPPNPNPHPEHVLEVAVDNEDKPGMLLITYKGYLFEIGLGKP